MTKRFPGVAAAALLVGLVGCAGQGQPPASTNATAGRETQFADLAVRGYQNNVLRNYADAETLYRRAFELRESGSAAETWELADPLLALALQLSNQGRTTEAEAIFDRVDRFIAANPADPILFAYARLYRSQHEANQGDFRKALTLLREGMPELQRQAETAARLARGGVGVAPLQLDERQKTFGGDVALAAGLEARYLYALGDLPGALSGIDRAEKLATQAIVVPRRLAPTLAELRANIAEKRGDLATAEAQQAVAVSGWNTAYRDSRPAALAVLRLGDLQAKRERGEAALASYRSGAGIVRRNRQSVGYDQLGGYFDLLYALGERDTAQRQASHRELFEVAQLVRNSVTAQAVAMAAARIAVKDEAVGSSLRALQDAQRRRDILGQRAAALIADESRAQDDTSRRFAREARAATEQGLQQADRDIGRLQPQLDAALARYSQLIDSPVSAADIVAATRPGEAMVDMVWGRERGFVMLVQGTTVTAFPIAAGSNIIDPLVARVRRAMEPASGYLEAFDVTASNNLYRTIFGPLEGRLGGVDSLVIAPSGTMLSVPPAILATDPGTKPTRNFDYSGVSWLVERSAVSVVPSARTLVDLRRGEKGARAPKAFAGFGDFKAADPRLVAGQIATRAGRCIDDLKALNAMPPLPETAQEVTTIGHMLANGDEQLFLGDAFTQKAVMAAPLADYRVLYFATHGLLAGELKCELEPSLVVTPEPAAGPDAGNTGLLEASEIADLKLNADLVVLSACNTGGSGNKGDGGESLSGLARSFLFAGARGMVVSHWTVPSEETAELMTATFSGQEGATTAGALRRAQLAMIASGKAAAGRPATATDRQGLLMHPFFWGGFAYVGAEAIPTRVAQVH